MAALARRDWGDLLDEVLLRSGGKNYSGWSARVQQFISAAYYDICSLYRHIELEATEQVVSATNGNTISLANSDFEIHHVNVFYEYEPGLTGSTLIPTRILDRRDFSTLVQSSTSTAARPSSYALFALAGTGVKRIHFDCIADQARTYAMHYQMLPERPDFSGTDTPLTGQQWDEHLIELALAKLGAATGDQQLAAVNAALYKDFVSQVAQPLIDKTIGSSTPEASTSNKMSTGKLP